MSPATPNQTLTSREKEMVCALCAGFTKREVAAQFGIARNTVNAHLHQVYIKTGVENQIQLVLWAVRNGLVVVE